MWDDVSIGGAVPMATQISGAVPTFRYHRILYFFFLFRVPFIYFFKRREINYSFEWKYRRRRTIRLWTRPLRRQINRTDVVTGRPSTTQTNIVDYPRPESTPSSVPLRFPPLETCFRQLSASFLRFASIITRNRSPE